MQNVPTGRNFPLSALSLASAMALATPAAYAATITVNNNGDPVPGSSPNTCTLRQAFVAINQHATGGSAGNCANTGAAFGTTDTIQFANGVTSISLDGATNGELDIVSGNDLTIDGGSTLGHVTIRRNTGNVSVIGNRGANSFANLTLTGLTISNGDAVGAMGGGVFLNANGASILTLNNSVVSGNHADTGAGGVFAFGVELNNSTVSGNNSSYFAGGVAGFLVEMNRSTVENNVGTLRGGGIFAFGSEVYDSVISGNTVQGAGIGGGIYAYATVKLSNTILSNNSADESCGGISSKNNIYLTNSTISGNNAVAVCSLYGAGTSAISTTFSANPGNNIAQAIYSTGGVYLSNSTVSGNSGPGAAIVLSSYAAPQPGAMPSAMHAKHGPGMRNLFGHNADAAQPGSLARQAHQGRLQSLNTASALTLISSIVSQNNDASDDIFATYTVAAAGGFNLIGNVSNTISLAALTNEAVGNPALSALANNGCFLPAGEPTSAQCVQTMALSVTSPAYNSGNANGNATDERGTGFVRVSAGAADIGAFELQPTLPVASPASASTTVNTPVGITLHATDTNPGTFNFTFTISSPPSHGTVVLGTPATTSGRPTPAHASGVQFSYSIQASNGTVVATYTPNTNYSGPDSFTFTATNTDGTSAPATVNITVSAAAAIPVVPAPLLSRWAWLALIAQLGWAALYKLRRLGR